MVNFVSLFLLYRTFTGPGDSMVFSSGGSENQASVKDFRPINKISHQIYLTLIKFSVFVVYVSFIFQNTTAGIYTPIWNSTRIDQKWFRLKLLWNKSKFYSRCKDTKKHIDKLWIPEFISRYLKLTHFFQHYIFKYFGPLVLPGWRTLKFVQMKSHALFQWEIITK